jgi:hypothetical protein
MKIGELHLYLDGNNKAFIPEENNRKKVKRKIVILMLGGKQYLTSWKQPRRMKPSVQLQISCLQKLGFEIYVVSPKQAKRDDIDDLVREILRDLRVKF